MAKIKLTEGELRNIVQKIINEDTVSNKVKNQPYTTRIEFDDRIKIGKNQVTAPLSQGAIDDVVKYSEITEDIEPTDSRTALIKAAVRDGYLTGMEPSAGYVMAAAKKIGAEFDLLHHEEKLILGKSYYNKFLKTIHKTPRVSESKEITESDIRKVVENVLIEYSDTYDQYVAGEYTPEEQTVTTVIATDQANDFTVQGELESDKDGDEIYWYVTSKKIIPGSYNPNFEQDVITYFNENSDWINEMLVNEVDNNQPDDEAPDYIHGSDR
jgi:hypothetical protein